MEKTGGLDAQVSIPSRAEQAVYPEVVTVTGESSSVPEREKRAGESKWKTMTHTALKVVLSHRSRKLLEHSIEKKPKDIHTHTDETTHSKNSWDRVAGDPSLPKVTEQRVFC